MNIAIVVEGQTDRATYPIFINQINPDLQVVLASQCGGKVKTKFPKFLKYFHTRRDKAIQKVLVIQDSDCSQAQIVEDDLRERFSRIGLKPSFEVQFYATKCELESLLLADENAFNRVAQNRGRTNVVNRIDYQCEVLKDAQKLFRRKLREVGLPVTEAVYAEIAREADIQIIRDRCPYFREFIRRFQSD